MMKMKSLAPFGILALLMVSLGVCPEQARAQWSDDPTANIPISAENGVQILALGADDGTGGAVFVWADYRSGDYDIYMQRVNSTGIALWTSDGVAVCVAPNEQIHGGILSNGEGNTIIIWFDDRNGDDDIYAQHVNGAGISQWTSNGLPICTATADQRYPELVSDGSGGAIVTWIDERGVDDDIYVRRVNNLGELQWSADGVAICTATADQRYPEIVSDGSGGAIITWYDYRNGDDDIYAQRVSSAGVPQWMANGIPICTATDDQQHPKLVSDGNGGAIITWIDHRSGDDDIYAQRVSGAGILQWAADGIAVCTAMDDQEFPFVEPDGNYIESDGSGGAIITWRDERSGEEDVYAQLVSGSGTPQWGGNGIAICTAPDDQEPGAIVSDGSGGVLLTWWDDRSGLSEGDIYAQRVSSSGMPQWAGNGVAISTAANVQFWPTLLAYPSGESIIVWTDARNDQGDFSDLDIYAQKVNAYGFLDVFPPTITHEGVASPEMGQAVQVEAEIVDDGSGISTADLLYRQRGETSFTSLEMSPSDDIWSATIPGDDVTPEGLEYFLRAIDNAFNMASTDTLVISVSSPEIALSVSMLEFGDVIIGASRADSFTVSNVGTGSLLLESAASDSPDFVVSSPEFPQDIAPGDSIEVTVVFSPSSVGEAAGSLTMSSNDPDEPLLTVALEGTGVLPDIALSDTVLAFTDVAVGSSRNERLTVSNVGSGTLVVDSVRTDTADFTIPSPTFPQDIDPGSSIEVIVMFMPSSLGEAAGTLTISSDDPDEPTLSVGLSGNGVEPPDTTAPEIDHGEPIASASKGDSISIEAAITDDSIAISAADLYYRRGGEASFTQVAMQSMGDDNYQATIPGSAVTERGVEYYISATDGSNVTTDPLVDAEMNPHTVRVTLASLARGEAQPSGETVTAYRMFSVPIELDDGDPGNVLEDNLGSYEDADWRFGRYDPQVGEYQEYPDVGDFAPGRAFWLIVRDAGREIRVGSGMSVSTSDSFAIDLQPGWNQIAVPFAFPVAWSAVAATFPDSMGGASPVGYDGSYTGNYNVSTLRPWEGYWVENLSSFVNTVRIPPVETSPGASLDPPAPVNGWRVAISVSAGELVDGDNYLGVYPDASDDWDRNDWSEPPPLPGSLALYFDHPDWGRRSGRYMADIRRVVGEGQTWEFLVETILSQSPVQLTFDDVGTIPDNLDVFLLDEANGEAISLRETAHYEYVTGASGGARRLYAVVGSREYVDSTREQLFPVPEDYFLAQSRPNPFSSDTEIQFQLPARVDGTHHHVTLTIYDLLGREVATVLDEPRRPGYYTVNWDGKDRSGRKVASGTYGYRLSVDGGRWSKTKQMVLLR